MRTIVTWTDSPQLEDEDGTTKRSAVWDLTFKPDGTQLVAAYGRFLLLYDAATGEVLRQKEAHEGDIYTLSANKDGSFFASGGADKKVCIWNYELAMKYTFSHVESIQALAFNPVNEKMLASCSAADFAIWTMPSPQLRKTRVASKILCAAWSSDGATLALGMLNGTISLRDSSGAEKKVINRAAPIWDLAFTPPRAASSSASALSAGSDGTDNLVVACWDGTLSFYSPTTGERVGRERDLGLAGNPCSLRHFSSGEYLLVGGADRKATLFTRDGVKLSTVADAKDWIWRAAARPRSNAVAVASNDGTISMHSITFSTVHGLYQDRYAFRDAMTDVVVQHLVSEQRVRIKCRDYVKKIAVYRDRLAVQLPDRIVIYALAPAGDAAGGAGGAIAGAGTGALTDGSASGRAADMDAALTAVLERGGCCPAASSGTSGSTTSAAGGAAGGAGAASSALAPQEFNMGYRAAARISQALECNLLVVTSRHVILCQERKLQLYDERGGKEREWVLDAVIRYIKVVGGPSGREGLLVGLKNGAVLRIFVDNPFPQQLIKHSAAVRCLDLSMSRRKLAVVDEASVCTVYDVASRAVLFSESGANSVSWNGEMEDMLCFSGNGQLSIKTGTFPLHSQKMQGFVVGFSGSKVFCLHSVAMQTIDVPQSASLHRYVEARDWELAYRVACLGVTDSDWRALGEAALRALALPVARAAFSRLGDTRYLELIAHMEVATKKSTAGSTSSASSGAGAPSSPGARGALTTGGAGSAASPGARGAAAAAAAAGASADSLLAEVLAYAGRYLEAARLHLRGGSVSRAIEMLSDLRLWNEAKRFAEESGSGDVTALMLRQAAWCEELGDAKAAATIYSAVGQCTRAVTLLGERGLYSQLMDLVRGMSLPAASTSGGAGAGASAVGDSGGTGGADGGDGADGGSTGGSGAAGASAGPSSAAAARDVRDALSSAAGYFRRADLPRYAQEVYGRLGDAASLVALHLELGQYEEALALATAADKEARASGAAAAAAAAAASGGQQLQGPHGHGQGQGQGQQQLSLLARVHLAYGEWLASQERLEEAQEHYDIAGRPDLSARVHRQLAAAALAENRFADAAVFLFRLAASGGGAAPAKATPAVPGAAAGQAAGTAAASSAAGTGEAARLSAGYRLLGELYRAYALIDAFVRLPFAPFPPDAIFQAARFILQAAAGTAGRLPDITAGSSSASSSAASEPAVAAAAAAASGASLPPGMSKAAVVYALIRQAVALGAHKSTRAAVDAAAPLLIPRAWRDTLDAAALHAATKPLSDPEHLCTTCYRCATVSAGVTLLSRSRAPTAAGAGPIRSGDRCPACEQPYVRCMLTFEVLPLVEFVVPDAAPQAVLRALEQGGRVASGGSSAAAGRAAGGAGAASAARGGAGGGSSGQDVLHFDAPDAGGFGSGSSGSGSGGGYSGHGGSGAAGNKAFNALLQEASTASISSVSGSGSGAGAGGGAGGPAPVSCPMRVLELLPPSEVFVTGRGTAGSSGKAKAAAAGAAAPSGSSASSVATGSGSGGGRLRFWKSVIPDIGVASCGLCDSFFSLPDFEFECLKAGGACPVCKHKRA